jgi:acyl-CoA reductase-like NAD-dependent aldehyde dehydrogenase
MGVTWTLIHPATDEPLREAASTSDREMAAIVPAARAAQREWRWVPVAERAAPEVLQHG